MNAVPMATNQGFLNFRCGKGLLPEFLFYWFRANGPYLDAVANGSTYPELYPADPFEFEIAVPPPPEPQAIVDVLSSLDEKFEANRRANATLEAKARAIFKSWFVDFDPVRAKAQGSDPSLPAAIAGLFPSSLVESDLGEIPSGWNATTLGREAERRGGRIQTGPFGSQLHASDYVPDGVPVVMPQDISNRRVSTQHIARIREADAHRLSRHRLQFADIVYSRRGDVEQHAYIGVREAGWLCGTGCLPVRMGPAWPAPAYASLALDRPESRAWIAQHAIGATMPNLNTAILSSAPFLVPPDVILYEFGRLIDPLDQLICAKNAESKTLAALGHPERSEGSLCLFAADTARPFVPLPFQQVPTVKLCNSFLLITIRIARGWVYESV